MGDFLLWLIYTATMLVSAPIAAKAWKDNSPVVSGIWIATFVSASIQYAKWVFQ